MFLPERTETRVIVRDRKRNQADSTVSERGQVETQKWLPLAEELVVKLSSVSDARQRSYALALRLETMENEVVVGIIRAIHGNALDGEEVYVRLYNGLIAGGLADVFGPRRMSELVQTAQESGAFEIVSILMDFPKEGGSDIPHQPFLDGGLREMPLGVRKELARRPDFKLIDRIARDQDHRVIRNLLNNSRLTEHDVVRIAATRPTSAKVLEAINDHPKWTHRRRVKKAIVLNPHTPPALAMRLLAFMKFQDLEQIEDALEIDALIREEAGRIMRKKQCNSDREYVLDLDGEPAE
jgi:hypothetical protein